MHFDFSVLKHRRRHGHKVCSAPCLFACFLAAFPNDTPCFPGKLPQMNCSNVAHGTTVVIASRPKCGGCACGVLGLGPLLRVSLSVVAGNLCMRKCTTLSFRFSGNGSLGRPCSLCCCSGTAGRCRGGETSANGVDMGS